MFGHTHLSFRQFLKCLKLVCLATLFVAHSTLADMNAANKALNEKEYALARIALEASAKIGHAEAQHKLGVLHYQGLAGQIDKNAAVAWLFLASEYDYPNSMNFVSEIFGKMSPKEQQQAEDLVEKFMAQYGKQVLADKLYPTVTNRRIESQRYDLQAVLAKKASFNASMDRRIYSQNSANNNRQLRNVATAQNTHAVRIDNGGNTAPQAGRVVVLFEARADGRPQDVELLFDWPKGRFAKEFITSIQRSTYRTAKRDGEKVAQSGKLQSIHVYYQNYRSLENDYPHVFKAYKRIQDQQDNHPDAKYQLANFARAYRQNFSEEVKEDYEALLLEAAKLGHSDAQYDYGVIQLYRHHQTSGLKWIISAAKAGKLEAQYRLGNILYRAPSVFIHQDFDKAETWFRKAANKNYALAQQQLVTLLLAQGRLGEENKVNLKQWASGLEDFSGDAQADANTLYLLAHVYKAQGKVNRAQQRFEQALAMAKKHEWNTDTWQAI